MQKAASPGAAMKTRELLEALLRDLPEDPALLRKWRDAVQEAVRDFDPSRDALAAALETCLRSLRGRVKSLREARGEVVPRQVVAQEAVVSPPTSASPIPTRQISRWGTREKMLYRDVVNLFDLGDQVGAMISLERLTLLSPNAEDLALFFEKNEALLTQTYQESLGSLQRKVFRMDAAQVIPIPTDFPEEIERLLKFCDGHRRIEDLVRVMEQPAIRTLVMLSHLVRCHYLELS